MQRDSDVLVHLGRHDMLLSDIALVDASTLSNIARLYNKKEHCDYGKCCKGTHSGMLIQKFAVLNLRSIL